MAEQVETTLEQKISQVVSKLEKNEFTIYFYAPPMNSASGGVGVLFKQARILKDAGYNVKIIFEPRPDERASYTASMAAKKRIFVFEKLNPTWLDFEYSDIKIVPQVGSDENGKPISTIKYTDNTEEAVEAISLSTEDIIVIPEGFPNVMQQLAQSPAKKIVLCQSWIYILNSLQSGHTWATYGIKDVISVSDAITEYLNSIMPGLKIKQYSQGINRTIFNKPEKISDKKPMIGFSYSRGPENRMKTVNVVKTFQQFNPNNKFVRFIELSGMSRKEYADTLKSCSLILCTDEIAGFGTAPLEAMACGTHVVGWAPYGGKEYINDKNGFWAINGDIFNLAEYLGIAVDKLLHGELDNEDIQKSYEETLQRYTEESEKEQVLNIFKQYVEERINEIKQIQKK